MTQSQGAMMLDLVRPSTARVVELAQFVHLNEDRLAGYASTIPADEVRTIEYSAPFHYNGPPESLLNYIVALDAINFGSGFSQFWPHKKYNSIYKTTADGLRRVAESGVTMDGYWMQSLTVHDLALIFEVPEDYALMPLFRRSLNELGALLVAGFGGRPVNLLDWADHSAHTLVQILAERVSTFHDVAEYKGEPVYFLKRAQILCGDLFQAFRGEGWGSFHDIAALTCFADNAIPKVLHVDGLLVYAPELEERIARLENIEAGSPEEIELRAFAVQMVERLREILASRGEPLMSIQIDYWLWNRSQEPRYKAINSHKTQTVFY